MGWSKGIALASLLLGLMPAWAGAVPVKFADCEKERPIREVDGGSGAFYNEDCSILYVLPPQAGRLQINQFRADTGLPDLCDTLGADERALRDFARSRQNMADVLLAKTEQLKEYQKDEQEGLIPENMSEADLLKAISDLTQEIATLNKTWADQRKSVNDQLLNDSRMEGGQGIFLVRNTYSDLLKAYREANPHASVERLPLDESFLSFNEASKDDLPDMGAVLKLNAIGVGEMPALPSAGQMLSAGKDQPSYKAPSGSVIFGDALSGSITLTVAGACRANGDGQALGAYIGASASYAYQVQVRRDYKASLDLAELVRQIHEQVKRGGFFSTSTLDSFIDSRRSNEWVTFEDDAEDGRLQYTDSQITELKKEFLDRALAEIVTLKTGSTEAIAALIAPDKNGADQAGDALSKCPNLYCQIGAAGLHVLSAIFGSDDAVAELTKNMSSRHVETMMSKRMITLYGATSFQM